MLACASKPFNFYLQTVIPCCSQISRVEVKWRGAANLCRIPKPIKSDVPGGNQCMRIARGLVMKTFIPCCSQISRVEVKWRGAANLCRIPKPIKSDVPGGNQCMRIARGLVMQTIRNVEEVEVAPRQAAIRDYRRPIFVSVVWRC